MKSVKGITFALVSAGTFGLIPLFSIPVMNEGMNEPSILFYRFLFSTIIIAAVCVVRKENLKISFKQGMSMLVLSILYVATALCLLMSYKYIPSGTAITIHFMFPILVSIIMVVFFKEKKSAILFLSAILSLIGVVLLCWTEGGNINMKGIILASVTIVTYAIYIVWLNQSKVGRLSTEVLTFYIFLFGSIIFFIFALMTKGIDKIPSSDSLMRLISLGLLCTVISDMTLILAVKLVGSTVTSILGSTEPIVAVAIGVLVFSEPFGILSLVGVLLIIISVALVVSKKTNDSKTSKEM